MVARIAGWTGVESRDYLGSFPAAAAAGDVGVEGLAAGSVRMYTSICCPT